MQLSIRGRMLTLACSIAWLCSSASAGVPVNDHLLLCEVVVTPTAGEYIEIVNPTAGTIDLSNYYLSDYADYALIPGVSGGGPAPVGVSSDFIVRFPAGAMIAANEVQVIAFDGTGFAATFPGNTADYEINSTDGTVPDMIIEFEPPMGGFAMGLSNSGENVVLFFWDGVSDLVQDVDMVNVGTPTIVNAIADKSLVSVDGPDADAIATNYLADAVTMPQQSGDPGFGFSTKRIALEGADEVAVSGNGITGHDETTENIAVTWDSVFTAPSPGICEPLVGPATGACCDTSNFSCVESVLATACTGPTELFNANQTCAESCVAVGACCSGGNCYADVRQAVCEQGGGVYGGDASLCNAQVCAAPTGVTINELRTDAESAINPDDQAEYFELTGPANASLAGLTYIVLGDDFNMINGSGVVEEAIDLGALSLNGSGFFLGTEPSYILSGTPDLMQILNFENGDNVTHMLVSGFTGALDDDLDTDDDGVLDTTPWTSVVDCITLFNTSVDGNETYCGASIGPDIASFGEVVPAHSFRCDDGTGGWQIASFITAVGSDTPGTANECGACCFQGTCTDSVSRVECEDADVGITGAFSVGDTCGTLDCTPAACCILGVCGDQSEIECSVAGGTFLGPDLCSLPVMCPAPPTIVISEILYNPSGSEPATEWAEIYNFGGSTIDIGGWFLADEDGAAGALPMGTMIGPGEAVVITAENVGMTAAADFQAAWSTAAGAQVFAVSGWGSTFGLSNGPTATNEVLTIRQPGGANGITIDEANYENTGDWPASGQGIGIRLLCTAINGADPQGDNDSGLNWVDSLLGVNAAVNAIDDGTFSPNDVGSPGVVDCAFGDDVLGACCDQLQTCFNTAEDFCDGLGLFFDGTNLCESVGFTCPVVGAEGACCTEGTCLDPVTQLVCETNGGRYLGDGSACLGLPMCDCPPATQLIISEVVEGTITIDPLGPFDSDAPRYVEITNTGCREANLSAYSAGNFPNETGNLGGGSATALSGILLPGESAIFAYDFAGAPNFENIYGTDCDPVADASGPFINGNDPVVLYRGLAVGNGTNATLLDIYGVIGEVANSNDFSPVWAMQDTLARRLPTVVSPTATFNAAEWDISADGALLGVDEAASLVLIDALTDPCAHTFTPTCVDACISCGNGYVELGEDCDDGNVMDGDGCPSTCVFPTGPSCPGGGADECADLVDNVTLAPGADNKTDNVCVWWQCGGGTCTGDPTQPCSEDSDCGAGGPCVPSAPDECLSVALTDPSDMGGGFGNCEPDGFCNNADINHALLRFATANPCSGINIDAGGPFGACPPDGFGNLFDANHAASCFAVANPCTCTPGNACTLPSECISGVCTGGFCEPVGGPAPEMGPNIVGGTGLTLETSNRTVRRGATFQVQAYVNSPLAALSGYQVHTGVTGGRSGSLELVDVSIADRDDDVFATASGVFDAFNVGTSQMLSGLHGDGFVATAGKGYLATFTYRVSDDAVGTFVIDILHDESAGDQTFLVGADDRDKIEITKTTPAVVVVTSGASRSIR